MLSQLLHSLLNYKIQHATYLLPRGLLSRILRFMYLSYNKPNNHLYCTTTLGSDPSHHNTTLSHTNSQVGFVLRSAPPVTLCLPVLPLRGLKQTFFPTHLLHCYIHPSYKWTLPRGSEQACIDEPLLAQSCRRILLWAYHYAYSKRLCPQFLIYHIKIYFKNSRLVKSVLTLVQDNQFLQKYIFIW